MHLYLVPGLGKSPAYIILHIGSNNALNAIDIKASEIVKKLLKLKEFVQNYSPGCQALI